MSIIGRFISRALLASVLMVVVVSPIAAATGSELPRILVLGDSLAAGYGLMPDEAFPAQLERSLAGTKCPAVVINAGVSGDTTAGGLSRLDWALGDHPDMVIVELGGNDALRGLPPDETSANLDQILNRLDAAGVAVLLTGMRAPRNLGVDYYTSFDRIYPELARKHAVAFYPFFLDGVATDPELNQPDGIHPNVRGVAVIVERILPAVLDLLRTNGETSSCNPR